MPSRSPGRMDFNVQWLRPYPLFLNVSSLINFHCCILISKDGPYLNILLDIVKRAWHNCIWGAFIYIPTSCKGLYFITELSIMNMCSADNKSNQLLFSSNLFESQMHVHCYLHGGISPWSTIM